LIDVAMSHLYSFVVVGSRRAVLFYFAFDLRFDGTDGAH
jgi:hypothetical protein